MQKVKRITFKIGGMRKTQDWVVYPKSYNDSLSERSGDPTLFVQCSKRALTINLTTKKGMLSDGKGGHQGRTNTDAFMGGKEVDVSDEILALCQGAEPKSGDKLDDAGVITLA